MTSSYLYLRKRDQEHKRPNLYDVHHPGYMTTWGICPTGFTTYPIDNGTDAKVCVRDHVPLKPIPKREEPMRQGTYTLYSDDDPTQSKFNMFKVETRRNAMFDRSWYDKNDYTRLPFKFDGTGYEPVRGWKYGEYAYDFYTPDAKWEEHRLLQPHIMKKQSEKRREAHTRNPPPKLCSARDHYETCKPVNMDKPHFNYYN